MADDSPEVAQVEGLVDTAMAAFVDVEEEEWLSWGAEIMPLQAEALAGREAARKAREEEDREAERVRQEEAQKAEEAARLAEATEIVTDRLLQGIVAADELDNAVAAEVRALERKAHRESKAPSVYSFGDQEDENVPAPDAFVKEERPKRGFTAVVEIPGVEKRKGSKGKRSERPIASLRDLPTNSVSNTLPLLFYSLN
jgi:hypothetical protein